MSQMLDEHLDPISLSQPEVGLIPQAHLDILWPGVLEIIQEKGGSWLEIVSEEEVYYMIQNGVVDLWCAMQSGILDGFMLCAWEYHARASRYHICFLAGKGLDKYLAKGLDKVEKYACILGAKEVVCDVRPGFMRLLRKHGYGQKSVRLTKPVELLWRN